MHNYIKVLVEERRITKYRRWQLQRKCRLFLKVEVQQQGRLEDQGFILSIWEVCSIAAGKKLFLNLVVHGFKLLWLLLNGRRGKTEWPGCEWSLIMLAVLLWWREVSMESMVESLVRVRDWVTSTTCCNFLKSWTVLLYSQAYTFCSASVDIGNVVYLAIVRMWLYQVNLLVIFTLWTWSSWS